MSTFPGFHHGIPPENERISEPDEPFEDIFSRISKELSGNSWSNHSRKFWRTSWEISEEHSYESLGGIPSLLFHVHWAINNKKLHNCALEFTERFSERFHRRISEVIPEGASAEIDGNLHERILVHINCLINS